MSGRSSASRSSSSRSSSSRASRLDRDRMDRLAFGLAPLRASVSSDRARHRHSRPTQTSQPLSTPTAAPVAVARPQPATPRVITPSTTIVRSTANVRAPEADAGIPARGGVPVPAVERASDQAMRLLKRMRPDELREISRAASALEKAKLEDTKKVASFVAKTENFVDLVDNCYICLEPLLNNIGTTKFGVLSWRCRCTVAQKAHSACIFSKVCHKQGLCDMCDSPMLFEKTRRKGLEANIQFYRDAERVDEADPSSNGEEGSSSEDADSSSEEEEGGGNGVDEAPAREDIRGDVWETNSAS